ncbi:MAG: hypothetical protein ACREDF_11790 [Thermoplasmata archaeon]
MTHPENPFGDFEADFKNSEKAPPGAVERLFPPATYKFVCTTSDLKGDGVLVDHEVFTANTGTKGFKLYCEILDPESIPDPKTGEPFPTKGEIVEHVFWVTKKNLPYIKRDLATILGRDLASMEETVALTWAGRTFEGVLTNEPDNKGIVRNRIAFINPWSPPEESKETKKEEKKATETAPTKGATATAAGAGKGGATKPKMTF